MRMIGEMPLLQTRGQRIAALGFTLLGAAGATVGLAATGSFDSTTPKPAPHEVTNTHPDEVSMIAGRLCVNGTAYSIVDQRVVALPDEACSENTTTGNSYVTVGNAKPTK